MMRRIVCSRVKRGVYNAKHVHSRSIITTKNAPRRVCIQGNYLTTKRFYAAPGKHLGFPALSPSMETGKIAKWLKKEGEAVSSGQIIAQVETDKATVDWEASDDGFIAKLLVKEGESVQVGASAVVLVDTKEQVAEFANYKETSAPAAKPQTAAPVAPVAPAAPSKPKPPTLTMPALSPTMEEGKLVKWIKKEGDKFSAGESLAEIETDKATMNMEANDDGFVAKFLVQPGSGGLKVGSPIAIVVSDAADIAKWKDYTLSDLQSAAAAPAAAPVAAPAAPQASASSAPSVQTTASGSSDRVVASPLAKVEAAKKGIDLKQVKGTGPAGRIIAADIAEFVPVKTEAAQPTQQTTPKAAPSQAPAVADFIDIPNSNIRQITADRLTHSKQNIPHYYLTVDINMDKLNDLRATLNGMSSKGNEYKLSVNDFIVKAAALALKAVPEVNSEWRGTSIRRYNSVNVNVAVNTPKGLFTPIVRDADKLGLKTINSTVNEVAQRAKEGKSTVADLQLGTFTISNLGMFGITNFSAVINPPQAAILAVGGARKVVVVEEVGSEQKFKNATVMTVTLSCDHRVVDGAVGAQWLQVFRDLLENPMKFLL